MDTSFKYVFPAIRGVQAGREYYVSMCPLKLLTQLFHFDDEELLPELRAQRTLNRARIPEMSRYIVTNKDSYTFSAITASIDGPVQFDPVGSETVAEFRMGKLSVPMQSKFIVNDGQHRRAAIVEALAAAPDLGDETIAVVFFLDRGLQRCQQMFADLNRYAIRPSASLGLLYDHRSSAAKVAKHLSLTSIVFQNMIETERSSLSPRSRKLFTLSALHYAILELMPEREIVDFDCATRKSKAFWEAVGEHIPEWKQVRELRITSGEVRREFIHSYAIVLQALGRVGRALYALAGNEPLKRLRKLDGIDWSRRNAEMWEGRAMIGGGMAKSSQNITLTANAIKQVLGLKLTPEEAVAEGALQKSRTGRARNRVRR